MRAQDVMSGLIAAFNDWNNLLVNPRYCRVGDTVSWVSDKRLWLPMPVRMRDVLELDEQGQYSFQFATDGSLLQLSYSFSSRGGGLSSAMLAYYGRLAWDERSAIDLVPEPLYEPIGQGMIEQSPQETPDLEDISGEPDEPDGSTMAPSDLASWMRIDYDPNAMRRGVIHHDCHLQLCGLPNARIPLNGVPAPRQFVDFVVAMIHPDIYVNHRLDSEWNFRHAATMTMLNEVRHPIESGSLSPFLMHLAVPGC